MIKKKQTLSVSIEAWNPLFFCRKKYIYNFGKKNGNVVTLEWLFFAEGWTIFENLCF